MNIASSNIDDSDIDPDSEEALKHYENMRREIYRVYSSPVLLGTIAGVHPREVHEPSLWRLS